MCPACVATTATILAGTASAGGVTALIASFVYRRKQLAQTPQERTR